MDFSTSDCISGIRRYRAYQNYVSNFELPDGNRVSSGGGGRGAAIERRQVENVDYL
jgi:hypothetical protein